MTSLWLRSLRKWEEYAMAVACAVRKVEPEAQVFLTGGVAENRLTVCSDIDIVIALPYEPTFEKAVELRARILEEAEKLGLPYYAPVELHIVSMDNLKRYRTLKPIRCTKQHTMTNCD